jgi:Rho termination factor, N-terminal domain
MPTTRKWDNDAQSSFLSAVHDSQAAIIDVIRVWNDLGQQLTRSLSLPVAAVEVSGAVDRAFDVAEQTLAAQRQFARTLAGVATRQVDIAVDTVVETIDTTVETVEGAVRERGHQVEDLVEAVEAEQEQRTLERPGQPEAPTDAPKAPSSTTQDRRPDGRTYEERNVEELRERAAELQIEGRSSMSKDELIAALRDHRRSRSAKSDAPQSQPSRPDSTPDRRSYPERSLDELRERARELEIEGRSSMSKDELIAALRRHSR